MPKRKSNTPIYTNIPTHSIENSKILIKNKTILEIIIQKLIIRKSEKEEYGEVFTPLEMIYDMAINLPKNVWKNPQFKWIDTSGGIGNIMIVVFYLLMDGLKDIDGYKDEHERSKHIIENMLYMIEYKEENVAECKHIFNLLNESANPNIICADFLDKGEKWKTMFNNQITKFDINIGNPPYNIEGTKHKGIKNVYVAFAIKGLELLNPDGYLVYIHPPPYRISHHQIQCAKENLNAIYTNKQIIYIKMFTVESTKKLMNIMMNVDYIIIKNTNNPNILANPIKNRYETTIIDIKGETHKLKIIPHMFIPNFGISILKKMEQITTKNGSINIILTSEKHAQIIKGGTQYKNVHGITSKGIKICYSDKPHSLHNKRKLIINGIGSYNYVLYDENGEYGFTQSPVAINEPSHNTLQLIQSKLFHFIVNATKIIGNNFNIKTTLFLPIIDEKKVIIQNETELYNYLKLTKKEIDLIENKDYYSIPDFLHQEKN